MGAGMSGSVVDLTSHVVLGVFVLFCRIGACLMIAPGVSNSQIPMQVRLFVAIAVTLALAPILLDLVALRRVDDDPIGLTKLVVMEGLIGAMIGVLGRVFFSALEMLATVTANLLGLANPFGVEYDAGRAEPPIATLVMVAATAMLFAGDVHWEIIRGLVGSYRAIAPRTDFDTSYTMRQLSSVLGQSFLVAIRVVSPFFLYSVIVNFALSLVSRVAPQIQVFFMAPPFVVAGGVALLYFVVKGELGQFLQAFSSWLTWG